MAADGVGVTSIVRYLNDNEIPTPIQYARAKGLEGNYDDGNGSWNSRSVKYILTNRTYTGALVQGKERRVVEETHEPLVDTKTFDTIQRSFQERAFNLSAHEQAAKNILKGKVICGCCGGKMQRKRGTGHADWYFFTCITKNRLGVDKCTGMYVREENVLKTIYTQLKQYVKEHFVTDTEYKRTIREFNAQIIHAAQAYECAKDNLALQYERLIDGQISKEEYWAWRTARDVAQAACESARKKKAIYEEQHKTFRLLLKASNKKVPLGEIMPYIDEIVVDAGRQIKVNWLAVDADRMLIPNIGT